MAYERVVERFLNAKHDHIAAYTVETRGHRRPQPDKDLMLLTALAYEIEDFLGSLPKNYRTAELRGRLIYEVLRRVPRRLGIFAKPNLPIPIAARMDGGKTSGSARGMPMIQSIAPKGASIASESIAPGSMGGSGERS